MKLRPREIHQIRVKGMKNIKTRVEILVLVAVLGALTSACPQSGPIARVSAEEKAAVMEKLRRLEIRYEILQKDEPPQVETLPLRQKIAEVESALEAGDVERASALAEEAGDWLDNAREKYYRRHESRVVAGTSGKSGEDLMNSAELFMQKAREAGNGGDQWASDRYFQAAIEQGELALFTKQKGPDQAAELVALSKRLQAIYRAAGRPEQGNASNQRVVQRLMKSMAELDKTINDCIAGKAQGCERDSLAASEGLFAKKAAELNKLNSLLKKISGEAQSLAPGHISPVDRSASIASWSAGWKGYFNNQWALPTPPKVEPKNDREAELKAMIAKHNLLKQGAQPIQGSGISVEVKEIYTLGDSVIIRGKISNYSTEPVFKPRITVTGGVAGEIVDLGYEKFSPQVTTGFQIKLTTLNTEAFIKSMNSLPFYEVLVIYQDLDGKEKKVLKSIP
jgi:hypothetical protein